MKVIKSEVSEAEKHMYCQDETGHARIRLHQLFPGVEFAYRSIHMKQCVIGNPKQGTYVEIQYCHEGRMEYHLGNDYYYLLPGDLSVSIRDQAPNKLYFPTRHYHGISVGIHIETAPQCFSCFLKDVNVQPLNMAKRLCKDRTFFVIHGKKYVENIFAGLYDICHQPHIGYLKIKVLELLYVLSGAEPEEDIALSSMLSQNQVDLARAASAYLKEHAGAKITVSELAEKFYISPKHLRNAFKGVYGIPVSVYMKDLKMREAAQRLIQTNQSILEIACAYGYENPSKFTAAFYRVIGETPLDYRKIHRNLK